MSTGSFHIPPPTFGEPGWPYNPGLTARKYWAGANGKYEIINGRKRLKFNSYTASGWTQRAYWGSAPNNQYPQGLGHSSPSGGTSFVGVPWGNPESGYVPLTSAQLMKLQSRLVSKIKGHEFNLAVNAAQSDQLTKMVLGNLRKIGGAVSSLRRGNVAAAARAFGTNQRPKPLTSKDVAGRWLEMQYGWLPTLSDTFEAAKAFELLTQERKSTHHASLKSRGSYEASLSPSLYRFPGRYTTTVRITAELTENPSAQRSMGLYDPLSVAWEVIPWSFVVDWFIPIGTYLENLAIIPSLTGRFLTSTHWKNVATYSNGGIHSSFLTTTGTREYQEFGLIREVSTSLTTQRPSFVAPGLALNSRRILNAVALTRQLFR